MTEYQHVTADKAVYRDGTIKLHGPEGFEGMRKAGRLAAEILDAMAPLVRPGVSTEEIDRVVRQRDEAARHRAAADDIFKR